MGSTPTRLTEPWLQLITRLRQATAWQADHRSLGMFAPAKISTGEAAGFDAALVLDEASA